MAASFAPQWEQFGELLETGAPHALQFKVCASMPNGISEDFISGNRKMNPLFVDQVLVGVVNPFRFWQTQLR